MSWLSSGLAKIGISKDVQRAVTKPLAVMTLGPLGAAIPVSKPTPAMPAIEQVMRAVTEPSVTTYGGSGLNSNESAILAGFQAILNANKPAAPAAPVPVPAERPPEDFLSKNKVPLALAGGGAVLLLVTVMALKR